MGLYRRRNSLFDRIGDHYRHFIDGDHFLGRNSFEDSWMAKAKSNLKKDGNGYHLEVALPGFEKKDINVTVHNDLLDIVAQVSNKPKVESEYIIQELDTNTSSRTFRLHPDINTDAITVSFKNGMLSITLPYKDTKRLATDKSRSIEVA